MEPDPNSFGTTANASGTAKSDTIANKKVKSEDMVRRNPRISYRSLFFYSFNGSVFGEN